MTCTNVGGAIICGPSATNRRKRYEYCPMCMCTTEMVVSFDGWYGTSSYCCRCGDAWCDGDPYPRPFARGWRRKAIRRHRRMWDAATHGPAPTMAELFGEDFGRAA